MNQPLWNNEFSLGINVIDRQHKAFVNTLDLLHEAIIDNQTKSKISEIIGKLNTYIKDHFATEEKYFKEFNYDQAEEHIKKHRQFEKKFSSIVSDFGKDSFELSTNLVDFLEDWLVDHLNSMDKKYVSCFKSHGLS